MLIEMKDFGKDHWSTFAYAETCCVDNRGGLALVRLRINRGKRPIGGHPYGNPTWDPKYGTRIKDGSIPDTGHDDIDCLDDLERVGLLEWIGTLVNPAVKLTDVGLKVIAQLRQHKAGGGQFREFAPEMVYR